MLDDRKKKVLQAIVEEYINTAEPVSSAIILNKYDLKCSSATIRNEMADLDKHGYLEKVHTSSGRIPSAKGYRYYVDELLKDDNISLEEVKYISDKLETKVHEIEDLTKITANTISEITHYTTVTIGPKADEQIIQEIKFDEEINEKQIETLNYMFNNKLKGEPISKIDRPLEEYLFEEMEDMIKVIKPIITQIRKVLFEDSQIYLEGARRELDLPEFNSLQVAKNFMNILDRRELMEDMLNSGFAEDINVYIGEENEKEELKDFSVVTFKHKVGNKDMGTIGIIGPKRMDYSKVISVMKYISKKLNHEK